MTHLARHGALALPVPSFPNALSTPLAGNRLSLAQHLAVIRADIVALEAAWVAAAERDLARALPRAVRIDDRATLDRVTWDRYLAAATAAEPEFKPQLRRLYQQADNLERLLAMPVPNTARAA